jgi:hypothetical protein
MHIVKRCKRRSEEVLVVCATSDNMRAFILWCCLLIMCCYQPFPGSISHAPGTLSGAMVLHVTHNFYSWLFPNSNSSLEIWVVKSIESAGDISAQQSTG